MPDLDVVVYGATGFVGRLTAKYLAQHARQGTRVGLAGRSRDRLEQVRAGLPARAAQWPLLVADSADPVALRALAEATAAVATTVGPYARHGMPLVAACADTGTHYADLTGEVLFMRACADRYDAAARASGARIVHACGFDSIPSDLGVLVLHEAVREADDGELQDVTFMVTGFRAGVSGGTLASMKEQLVVMRADRSARAVLADPYALSPDRDREPDLGPQPDLRTVTRDRTLGRVLAPFVMAGANTRVVRRSNALSGWSYGRRLRYREVMAFDDGAAGLAKAAAMTTGLAAFAGGMMLGPTRRLLDRVLPEPGEGPSEQAQADGFFRIEIDGRTTTGGHYVCAVAAQGDPGYAATAVMFGESALALAHDELPAAAGVLTPATGIGLPLVERLRARGFTFAAAAAGAVS